MTEDFLEIKIIGDSGPFSQLGESIGYLVTAGETDFLVDCGGPIFSLLNEDDLNKIDGVVATHAHEDHKRWFTDLALYKKFLSPRDNLLHLLAAEEVMEDYRLASTPALGLTLSNNCQRIINYDFKDYTTFKPIAPRPKYRCIQSSSSDRPGHWIVVTENGEELGADRAKLFFHTKDSIRPRLLFKDPELNCWIEPQTFYGLNDSRFYQTDSFQPYKAASGLKISAFKAPAWHGPFTTSLLFEYNGLSVFFSSDTKYDPILWEKLTRPLRPSPTVEEDFPEEQQVIYGEDINNYIEFIWSHERYERAVEFYDRTALNLMIHDVAKNGSVVHTNQRLLAEFSSDVLLTHSPEVFTSLHPLVHSQKTFLVKKSGICEQTKQNNCYPMNALCYHKNRSEYFVGYPDNNGEHYLIRQPDGSVRLAAKSGSEAKVIEKIRLYQDIGGEYFPRLNSPDEEYYLRADNQIVKLKHQPQTTSGELQTSLRKELSTRPITLPECPSVSCKNPANQETISDSD